jgi:hypothetical protein
MTLHLRHQKLHFADLHTSMVPAPSEPREYSDKPTAIEIAEYIALVPAHLRKSAADIFTGRAVAWDVPLFKIDGIEPLRRSVLAHNDTHELTFEIKSSGKTATVVATIDIARQPEIRNLNRGEIVRVRGVIRHVSEVGAVHLKDVQFATGRSES